MTVPEIRQKLAARLRQGWCQGLGLTEDGKCCLLHGLSEVTAGSGEDFWNAVLALNAQLVAMGLATKSIIDFNDAPGRTFEEVLALVEGP